MVIPPFIRSDRELELNLRHKPRKRLVRERPEPLGTATSINQIWSMDFYARSVGGRPQYSALYNVIDDFNREGLGIEVDFSLPAERVTRAPIYPTHTLIGCLPIQLIR